MKFMEMNRQMELFGDGGLKDEGGTIDPVSGNDVPSGSLKKEVRDDIDAKVSEGEFVFPADVTRYYGLDTLMKMRQKAKQGIKVMEAMGQMGNSDEAILPDDIPFTLDDIELDDDEPMKFNPGGLAIQNSANTYSTPSQFANYSQAPQSNNPYTYSGIAPVQYITPNIPQSSTPQVGPLTFGSLMSGVYKEYINPETGERIQIRMVNGVPATPVPDGFIPYVPESVQDVDPVVDTGGDAVQGGDTSSGDTSSGDTSSGDVSVADTSVSGDTSVTTNASSDNDNNNQPEMVSATELQNMYKDKYGDEAIKLTSNGKEVSMPADNYNALLVSYTRLNVPDENGVRPFSSLQDYYDLPLGSRLSLIGQEIKSMTGGEVDSAYIKEVYDKADEAGTLGTTGIPLLDAIGAGVNYVGDAISNLLKGGSSETEVVDKSGGVSSTSSALKYNLNKKQQEELAAMQAQQQMEYEKAAGIGAYAPTVSTPSTAQISPTTKVNQDIAGGAGADPALSSIFTPSQSDDNDRDDNISKIEQDIAGGAGADPALSSMFSGFSNKSNRDDNESTYSPSTDPYSEPGRPGGMNQYSSPTASANIPTGGGSFIPFEKGGLAAKPKTKPKTKRNRKKGLGGNS